MLDSFSILFLFSAFSGNFSCVLFSVVSAAMVSLVITSVCPNAPGKIGRANKKQNSNATDRRLVKVFLVFVMPFMFGFTTCEVPISAKLC